LLQLGTGTKTAIGMYVGDAGMAHPVLSVDGDNRGRR